MLHYYQKDDGWIEFKTKEQILKSYEVTV